MRGTRRSTRLLTPPPHSPFSATSTSFTMERSRSISINPPDIQQTSPLRPRAKGVASSQHSRASSPIFTPMETGFDTTPDTQQYTSVSPQRGPVQRRKNSANPNLIKIEEQCLPSVGNGVQPCADAQSSVQTSEPNVSLLRKIINLTFRMLLAGFLFWACVVLVALAPDAFQFLRELVFPPPPIPLPYIAWSIGSNTVHMRDSIKQISILKASAEFDKASVALISRDVIQLAQREDVARDLSTFMDHAQLIRSSILGLTKKAAGSFEIISEDVRKSHHLVRKLDRIQSPPSQRPLEMEAKLVNHVEKLHTSRLPELLREVIGSFIIAEGHLHRLNDLAERAKIELQGETKLVETLQLVPPRLWKARWDRDPIIQQRIAAHKKTLENFQRADTLNIEFAQTRDVLLRYWKSLELFQSPRHLRPTHRRSNGTVVDFFQLIDEVTPELDALILRTQV